MAEIRWILTCDGNCPTVFQRDEECPQDCPNSYYEKEQLNMEVPDGA